MNKLALKLRRLNVDFPQFRNYLDPILTQASQVRGGKPKLSHEKKKADVRDYVGPGIGGQQVNYLMDLTFESNFEEAYRAGLLGSVSGKTSQAFSKFAKAVHKSWMTYCLDPKNVENVNWDLFYTSGHPFQSQKAEKYQEELKEYSREVDRLKYEHALRIDRGYDVSEAPLQLPNPPKAPKEEKSLDPSAKDFIEGFLDDSEDFSYEMFRELDGYGARMGEFSRLFKNPSKALKDVSRTLFSEYRKVKEVMLSDMQKSIQEEVESELERVFISIMEDMMPDLESFTEQLRDYSEERSVKPLVKMIKDLDRMGDTSVKGLSRIIKHMNNIDKAAMNGMRSTKDRDLAEIFDDIQSLVEDGSDDLQQALEKFKF